MSTPTLVSDTSFEALDIGCDSKSTWRTMVGDPEIDREMVKFPAAAGSFAAHHGIAGRPIAWEGEIRCTEAELTAIREQRDAFKAETGTFTFTDDDSEVYANCILGAFELGLKMRVTGTADVDFIVPYRIELYQLEV
jgi:hypothetical protein